MSNNTTESNHFIVVEITDSHKAKHVTQIKLEMGHVGEAVACPQIHLFFSHETAKLLKRFLEHQIEEAKLAPGFSAYFSISQESTPALRDYQAYQSKKIALKNTIQRTVVSARKSLEWKRFRD